MKKTILILIIAMMLIITGCTDKDIEQVAPVCVSGYELINDKCIKINDEPIMSNLNLEYKGIDRNYIIYIPSEIKSNAPVVFVLHGYSGNASHISQYSGMNDVAEAYKFAVVYPQGLKYNNNTHWNSELYGTTVDDIGFLEFLAKHVQSTFDLSEENTFISGHSNGGFMSYTMACQSSSTFKAYASYAGLMSHTTWNTCNPSKNTNILHIHGTNDTVVPNDGTMSLLGGFGGAPDVLTMLRFWTTYNQSDITTESDLDDKAHIYLHTSTVNPTVVKYIEINGQSHSWPNDNQIMIDVDAFNDTSQVIWEFFSQFIDQLDTN